jgi:hypothetical protein
MSEFVTENGVNKDKIRSFELLRKKLKPEIITFDELYERAKFIVHHNKANAYNLKNPPLKNKAAIKAALSII